MKYFYLIPNSRYNFFREQCSYFLGPNLSEESEVVFWREQSSAASCLDLSTALSLLARRAQLCPPVIKLIIPGERLTRYGSQRITIGCKKPIIRTRAQITNSAPPPPPSIWAKGKQIFWMQLRNYQILKRHFFHKFSPWSTDNNGQISLQYPLHAQCPIFNRRRVLLMLKFAHFDINGLLLNIAKLKPLKWVHLSIFGPAII